MKNTLFSKLLASALAVLALTTVISAKGFTKTEEYPTGKFTDVPENQWYAGEVKSAFELGFMKGQSDTLFAPNGNVTVAEGITMASRVHSIYNGTEIKSVTGGKWYDMYIAYAKENGLIKDGQFTNYDRNIMRYEMAVMFANAMAKDYFTAKNDIKDIPDVAETEEYYDELMMLYKAGVVLGSDEYGNFYATNPIKRSETAAIINRVALPENRKSGTLKEYGDRTPAAYLIDDMSMVRTLKNGVQYTASGWLYENPELSARPQSDYSTFELSDVSEKSGVTLRKDITSVTSGNVVFETRIRISSFGSRIYFEDLEGNKIFEITQKKDSFYAIGKEEKSLNYNAPTGNVDVRIEMDIDGKTAVVIIDDTNLGSFKMNDFADLSRVCIGTTDKDTLYLSISSVMMYMNYDVNEDFLYGTADKVPYGWENSENMVLKKLNSDRDTLSAYIKDTGKAVKTFDKVSDKLVYETYFLVLEGQDASLSLKNGDKTAVSINAKNGSITTSDGKPVRKYTTGVWQQVRIEADTNTDKALIKINGKNCLTVPFTEYGIDTIEIIAKGSGDFYFDDVKVFNEFDYADYCPAPVPVNKDEWYSGMSVCSLWHEGYHSGWDAIAPYEDLTPVLGYYDEGIPEVADWEIKMMVEHGYDYQRFCWFYGGYNQHIKMPSLCNYALHDGYFNAKYSDMLDFSIMWENAGSKGTKDEFYNNIWPYWVDWYLTDSRYFCIDNKPVITIYQPNYFKDIMGGVAGVKEAIDFMDAECKKLGYAGVIVYVSNQNGTTELNKEFADSGYDAKAAYHFGELAYEADYQKERMNAEFDAGSITFTPSVGIGVNYIGWTEKRNPLASPEDFKNVLDWTKNEYLPKYESRNVDTWHKKSILTNTWNEFGEGHYVFPSSLSGFDYLDAYRQVFSSVAGTTDAKHFDVVPTDNQKSRLGYLYAARYSPMRKLHYENTEEDSKKDLIPVKTWDFEKDADCLLWTVAGNTTPPVYDANEKALTATTTTKDGNIKMFNNVENFFNADKAKWLHVTMKLDKSTGTSGELYFTNDVKNGFKGGMGIIFPVIPDGEYHDYYVDMSTLETWKGEIKSIRFDPVNAPSGYYIKKIEFLSNVAVDSRNFTIDGIPLSFDKNNHVEEDGEIYINANPSTGFYALNQFLYVWNRWNGELTIKANNGTTFEFVVGSSKALVNGSEKTLKKAVRVNDGIVELPIKFIYDNAGYEYTDDGSYITLNIRGENIQETIDVRKPNEFEFNVSGDLEGFNIFGASGGVEGGYVTFTSNYDEKAKRYDPQFANSKVNIDTKIYDSVSMRIRPEFDDSDGGKDTKLGMYFTTTLDGAMNEAKNIKVDMASLTPDAEGFVVATLDLRSHEKWQGYCKSIRFDPSNRAGTFTIDYVRFNLNPDYVNALEEAQKAEKEAQALLMAADEGKPFYIKNADAEISTIADEFSNGVSKISVVEDDLRPGNKAFLITTDKETKVWTYICIPTRYKPGVTYKVDFEVRLVGDTKGNPATNIPVCPNFRYSDYTADGTLKDMADHPTGTKRISTDDGWVKMSVTHTVKANSPSRLSDQFSIFCDPTITDDGAINHAYMVDNIVVTVVE